MALMISLDRLDEVCGGAEPERKGPPTKVLSLDASNGMVELIAKRFGYKPRPGVVNATRMPESVADKISDVLFLGARWR